MGSLTAGIELVARSCSLRSMDQLALCNELIGLAKKNGQIPGLMRVASRLLDNATAAGSDWSLLFAELVRLDLPPDRVAKARRTRSAMDLLVEEDEMSPAIDGRPSL